MRRPPPSDFVAHGGRNRNGEHELLDDDGKKDNSDDNADDDADDD